MGTPAKLKQVIDIEKKRVRKKLTPVQSSIAPPITRFRDEYFFLSNFYPCTIVLAGLHYPTAEHAYQASKTLDRRERLHILNQTTPGKAKHAGRSVSLRPDWEALKLDAMENILRIKFERNSPLAGQLIATHPRRLVEGNNWNDRYWGMCNGTGHNHLGKLLMTIRNELTAS